MQDMTGQLSVPKGPHPVANHLLRNPRDVTDPNQVVGEHRGQDYKNQVRAERKRQSKKSDGSNKERLFTELQR